MSAFQLSPEQREAVENRGGTLLVSAAAGSGKTRVLVERLFRYITVERCDVDDFLIITFTRAAAAELRGRIVEELNRRLAVTPEDGHLRRQLLRVYRAEIKTIDAFCSSLIRENVHLLEEDRRGGRLTADFRTLEENEAALLRERTLQRVLEEYYERRAESGEGTLLADTFGYGRSDDALTALILDLYDKIQSHAYPLRWLGEVKRQWEELPEMATDMVYGRELLQRFGEKCAYFSARLRRAAEDFADVPALQKGYGGPFLTAAARLKELAALAEQGNWDAVGAYPLVFDRLGAVRGGEAAAEKEAAKAVWDRCKKVMQAEKETFSVSRKECLEDMRAMGPAVRELLELTEEFSLRYREEKTRRNAADFSDQEHDAILLLLRDDGTPTELGETVAARYREIMVDEYQDTNEVQNRIFAAVSKKQENLFVVGDVKQSIYRFRLADPGIFLKKYREFVPCAEAQEGQPRKLLLSKNYRSRREVLEAVNFVFSSILSTRMGEMEYGEAERLYAGNDGFAPRRDCETEFHLIDLPRRQEDVRKLKKQDAEARFVAERVSELLRTGFPVQGEEGPRPIRPEDIVILMRSPATRLKSFRAALEERNIPCSANSAGDFFETMEVAVTFQLLQLIDNPRQDVPLISVLSSPLLGFTPDRLAAIRAASPETDFYDALAACEGEDARSFLKRLGELRAAAKDLSVPRLLSRLYDEWNLPGVFGAMEGGAERRENLFALLEHARRFESAGYRGLFAFTAQLRRQLEQGEAPVSAGKSAGGGVRIMSIHKSKGLEFPVVILADLAHQFNRQDFSAPVLVHPELGLGPLCIDLKRRIKYPTLARMAVESRLSREMKAEEMRILYVAMTRAKEKLILVHSMTGAAKRLADLAAMASAPAEPEALEGCGSMGEWILLPLLTRPEAAPLRELAGCLGTAGGPGDEFPWRVACHDGMAYKKRGAAAEQAAPGGPAEPEVSLELLDFVYPYGRETTLPTVISATQLKHRAPEEGEQPLAPHIRGLKRPAFLEGTKALTGAEAGTATHLLMQYMDFGCEGTEEAVRAEIQRLLQARCVTPAQAAAIRVGEAAALLRSPLGKRLKTAELHREYRLSLLLDARELDSAAAEGEQILLHGVVDCWFEKPDGTVAVVDFKTDRVYGAALTARAEEYRPQVETYCRALERILEKEVSEKLLYFFSEGMSVSL
ncbi:MAG: helicase-exonuclease AddAB subunit AddA [Oscillospiraceae bacterium]